MRTIHRIAIGVAAGLLLAPPAMAQPALDRVLSGARVMEGDHCAVVRIGFHFPVSYISYFPLDSGTQLNIRLKAIEGAGPTALHGRESIAAPKSAIANIYDIEYEGDRPDGPALSIIFKQKSYYHIGQGSDFLSIIVAVSDVADNAACTPQSDPTFASAAGVTVAPAPGAALAPSAGLALPAPTPEEQKLLDDARAAVSANDFSRAIQLLTKFLQGPDNSAMADAREMLGVARERNGQAAHAKAEYEEYLRRYPDAPEAGRVRQRLAALLARALHPEEQNGEPGAEPPAFRWESNASISEYFYHDELATTIHDQGDQITIDNGLTSLQSELVSSLDASVAMIGQSFRAMLRASGSYTKDFLTSTNDQTRVGELYVEVSDISRSVLARVGRQYRSTGGVLGRIDGAFVSFRLDDQFKFDLIGGFPVDSSLSRFSTHRYAYGASLDFAQGPFSADIYTLRQMDDGFLDRQSIGVEGRYVTPTFSAFSTIDYDAHFGKINIALLNANFMFPDQTSINFTADYRRAPMLRTSDALIGQPVTALSDLLSTYTRAEIDQLALDRTATSTSLFASINHPLSEQYSVGFDATLWNMSGMPASGGVPAIPSTGTEYYFSGHLIGTGLFSDGDLEMMSLGYASMGTSKRYTFDLNTRYPVTHDLRVGPRLFASYRKLQPTLGNPSGSQISVRPTLRLTYRLRPDMELELEGGMEWQRDVLGTVTTQSKNYLVDFGIRFDF